MRNPSRSWLLVLALLIMVLAHGAWLLEWTAQDGRIAPSICCDLSGAVADIRNADVSGRPLQLTPWSIMNRGSMSWLAVGVGNWAGWHEDVLLWTQILVLGLSQLVLYWALRPVFQPAVCLMAALLLPLVPGVSFFARHWSPYPVHTLILLATLGALIRSRSMTRPLWLLVVSVLGWSGWVVSPMLTDNMLFLAVFGLLILPAVLRGLIWERGPRGEPVSRLRVLGGVLLSAGVCAALLQQSLSDRGNFTQNMRYYLSELGLSEVAAGGPAPVYTTLPDPLSALALTAYPRRLWEMELGGLLSVLVCLGVLRLLLHGPRWARAELLGGLLGPLLLLSLIAKKQPFYMYLILPFVPAVAAAVFAEWGGRVRGVAVAAGAAVIGVLATSLVWLSDPSAQQPVVVERNPHGAHVNRVPSWQRAAMQMPYPLHLGPLSGQLSSSDTFLDALGDGCQTLPRVAWLGAQHSEVMGEPDVSARWRWRLAVRGQCLDIDHRAPPDRPPPEAVVLESGPGCVQEPHMSWSQEWAHLSGRADWQVAAQRTLPDRRCQQLLVHDRELLERLRDAGL